LKVTAAQCCDVEKENSRLLDEEWLLLVAGSKKILILMIGTHWKVQTLMLMIILMAP
jgi:hypothetical protein